jgi:hypothetical protein
MCKHVYKDCGMKVNSQVTSEEMCAGLCPFQPWSDGWIACTTAAECTMEAMQACED